MSQNTHLRMWNVLARIGITLAAFGFLLAIRPDWSAKYWRWIGASRSIENYVHSHKVRKLQIGAGSNNLPGWLNTDIEPREGQVYLDATRPLPFEGRSLNYILSEQVIEHLTYDEGLGMLKESYRVLAPGGKIRIATPNLLRLAALLQPQGTEEVRWFVKNKIAAHGWPMTPDPECYIVNLQMREDHRFVYTPKMLRAALESAGFGDIKQFRPGESDDLELVAVEIRPKTAYRDVDAFETMVFQASAK